MKYKWQGLQTLKKSRKKITFLNRDTYWKVQVQPLRNAYRGE